MTTLDRLQAQPVLETVRRLENRIGTRFPQRGLRRVAAELEILVSDVGLGAGASHGRLRMARLISRIIAALLVAGTVVLLVIAAVDATRGPDRGVDWVPLIESAINDVIFVSIATWFLFTIPERLERSRLLELLHRLRSLAHIVDMHQLTKDPERLRPDFRPTSASADPGLNRDEMEHYLDYCSELLSLIGKTAALCAEESRDTVVLDTVSTVESLTTAMSRKIWQKISLLPAL